MVRTYDEPLTTDNLELRVQAQALPLCLNSHVPHLRIVP